MAKKHLRVRLTKQGQITLPKEVRERLGLQPGDELQIFEGPSSIQIWKATPEPSEKQDGPSPLDKWGGFLKEYEGQDVDKIIEDMRGPFVKGVDDRPIDRHYFDKLIEEIRGR